MSAVYLRVDRVALDRLYRALESTPRVSDVTLKSAAIESHRKTLAESIAIVRTVPIVVALIIAFGVVYNTSRSALSERARELGTLRVIGLSPRRGRVHPLRRDRPADARGAPARVLLGYGLAAATVRAYDTEVYRIPLVVSARTVLASWRPS